MNRQRLMALIMLGVFIAIGAVVYLGFFRQPSASYPGAFAPLPIAPINAEALVNDEDLRILDDPRFMNLKAPSGIPIVVPASGKTNPFAP